MRKVLCTPARESKAPSQNARMAMQLIPTPRAKRAGKFVWPNKNLFGMLAHGSAAETE